jgi:hypothetical protein
VGIRTIGYQLDIISFVEASSGHLHLLDKYALLRKQPHILLLSQSEDTEGSRLVIVVRDVDREVQLRERAIDSNSGTRKSS